VQAKSTFAPSRTAERTRARMHPMADDLAVGVSGSGGLPANPRPEADRK
jgi:hypothetical protein